MDLKGKQAEAFRDALVSAFPSWSDLEMLVRFKLDRRLVTISTQYEPIGVVAFKLISWAEAEGLLDALLLGARTQNPGNKNLLRLSYELGLTSDVAPTGTMEAMVVEGTPFQNPAQWRALMERSERCVARLECLKGSGCEGVGTGFLVGPDLLMTNSHVVDALQEAGTEWQARFDFSVNRGGLDSLGQVHRVDKIEHRSPISQLDYAILKLATKASDDTVGSPAQARGRIELKSVSVSRQQPLFVLQHPNAERLKLGVGVVTELRSGPPRVLYSANTQPGSSGAPCFNLAWEPVAIHHAGEQSSNRGVPLRDVLMDLTGQVSLG